MAEPTDIGRRFFEALLGVQLDPAFTNDDVWMYMPRLLELASANTPLPTLCLTLLGDLSLGLGLKAGAPVPDVMQAIERTFGACPFGNDDLLTLARYLREQRNGGFATLQVKKGPSIRGEF